ncbi:carbohydrate ABC transporter substrate-binding protein [Sinorhizobium meliloti WSM1022]|jgi:glucose/mannose transport system substrate-binding protein|uniref:Probable sugar-binding periplasmic protein n=4 Tax=Rhizobium meliloti TaxID=382 RepID=SP39_RHIME|nr:RecName: Full=Probable sugar-binding periplasmic protein; Flags: Precursor [Sinorhizobium meliloti 1021]AEG05965.1 extracellular solute-binding protein family 1 [Sinorhizobium meliloti BL225C]AEG54999.1 extracellular solute-binding protein family 1 [Sinorhizobium meliloti AK83]AEH80659.1 ABC transporter, periplasmic solute-binding protein [Sinorhizobium meliloti SM11]AGA08271.1 ABC-type sugar transport system, periplasmic component [Sinorhizobium meliloti GR4]AGG75900.1 Putative dextrin ABC
MRKFMTTTAVAALMLAATAARAAENVEVLHWWTSGGEAAALDVLKKDLESKGISWTDMPVAGGGGTEAMTVLRARVTAGNAPTAVQMLGFDILDWAKEGALGNLDEVAAKEGWDKVVPAALQQFSKYDGHWIAAPVNVHSTNWVWINKAALDKAGAKEPTTWEELIALLDKFKEQGITPIAHGGQPWQDATIFDAVVLSLGNDFYKQAFIDLDPAALGGDKMKEAFDRMTKLRSYVDDNFSGRDWNLASAMVIENKAGLQFMGDWAKGEFLKAKKVPGTDFVCMRFPGTQGSVTFNSDQFAMFKVSEDKVPAQLQMASAIESPAFQSAFNVVKGSVPARTDVPDTDFDACGKKGIKDLAEANTNGTLFGSMAHGHANPAAVKNAIYDVVTRQFNGELNSEEAVTELVAAVEAAK